jgi:hypothetical protein
MVVKQGHCIRGMGRTLSSEDQLAVSTNVDVEKLGDGQKITAQDAGTNRECSGLQKRDRPGLGCMAGGMHARIRERCGAEDANDVGRLRGCAHLACPVPAAPHIRSPKTVDG